MIPADMKRHYIVAMPIIRRSYYEADNIAATPTTPGFLELPLALSAFR